MVMHERACESGTSSASQPGIRSLRRAAYWYAVLRDESVTPAQRLAWQAWLARSDEHRLAWSRVDGIGNKFAPLRGHGPAAGAAAAAAVEAGSAGDGKRRRMLGAVGGVLGLALLGWSGWRHEFAPAPLLVLRTGPGERRSLALEDGSRVWLNARSALQVDYGATQRRLVLLDGEILVETAVDSRRRPFLVETGHGRMQALGTRFSVSRAASHTRLDVFEGVVAVGTARGARLRVGAGQAASFDAGQVGAPVRAQRMREAWRRGSLSADGIALQEVLREIGRYHDRRIHVAPDVAGMRVMGVFPLDDAERTLAMLASSLPIRIGRGRDRSVTVAADCAGPAPCRTAAPEK